MDEFFRLMDMLIVDIVEHSNRFETWVANYDSYYSRRARTLIQKPSFQVQYCVICVSLKCKSFLRRLTLGVWCRSQQTV